MNPMTLVMEVCFEPLDPASIAVHLRMHKLPYLAPVLGAVGLDRVVTVAHLVPAATNTL